ncbi:MAG: L,D-transpeptidase Cds6 family protein [Pseudomonadales bacterium]
MPSSLIPLWFLIASFGLQATEGPSETLAWPDGTRYVGGVKNQMRDGQGTIYWQNGARYIGGFKADRRHGPGMMIMPDGTTYQGNFSDGKLLLNEDTLSETADSNSKTPLPITEVDREDITSVLDLWAAAWMAQNPEQYLGVYSQDFVLAPGESRVLWEMNRRERILSPSYIQIDLSFESFQPISESVVDVKIRQSYRSDTYREISNKVMRLQQETSGWRIIGEQQR